MALEEAEDIKRWPEYTGEPDVLQSMGLQRVTHDWSTELSWICSVLGSRLKVQSSSKIHLEHKLVKIT